MFTNVNIFKSAIQNLMNYNLIKRILTSKDNIIKENTSNGFGAQCNYWYKYNIPNYREIVKRGFTKISRADGYIHITNKNSKAFLFPKQWYNDSRNFHIF